MVRKDTRKLLHKLFGYCPQCKKYFRAGVKVHRRLTSYREHHLNFLVACDACKFKDDNYFKKNNKNKLY
jgi:RNase P subunit RPR2